MKNVIGISFSNSKKIYYFLLDDYKLEKGDNVITNNENGEAFGTVVTDVIEIDPKKLETKLKKITRKADKEDIETNKKNIKDAEKALKDAKKIAKDLDLDMTVLDSHFSFDRSQLQISFLADSRVDFRELVKKLASVYKTRIEMRQIGVRDKAKVVGGCGQCGRSLCCSTFLRDLNSVSINMAKNQNLALNPQKINGACGRLMCCLAYENDDYSIYKKGLPKVGDKIVSKGKAGKVIYVDIFARTCKIETEDMEIITVEYKK